MGVASSHCECPRTCAWRIFGSKRKKYDGSRESYRIRNFVILKIIVEASK
jgi:hypothetical protein